MSTLAGLARVERELRIEANCTNNVLPREWADIIAGYIARAKEQGYADIEAERDALLAACAAKDAALKAAGVDDPDALRNTCEMCDGDESECPASCWVKLGSAALSTDAGSNMIDASGAVESEVCLTTNCDDAPDGTYVSHDYWVMVGVPDAWAGRTVLVALKP